MDLEELALGLRAAVAAVLTRAAGVLHLAFVQLQQEQKPGFETCSDQRDFSYAIENACQLYGAKMTQHGLLHKGFNIRLLSLMDSTYKDFFQPGRGESA